MAIMMKRQLNDQEKQIVLQRHGKKCYATGHAIPDGDKIHFDHIRAYSCDGATDLNNIAPMCEKHNLQKGQLSLEDFRVKLRMEEFFNNGKRLTLRDLLKFLMSKGDVDAFGKRIELKEENADFVVVENADFKQRFRIERCPLTKWKYFYGILPVSVLDSDDEDALSKGLQPRYLIFDKVFDLFRHFQKYPVLQPSIGRIDNGRIVLFDGQHKAAALLWTGRREFECKIYIDPDLKILNTANIRAHEKFAQTRFFSSIMVLKLGAQIRKSFEEYKNSEDSDSKTEVGFLEFLSRQADPKTRAELRNEFRSYLYRAVLEDDDNQLKTLVSVSNRGSKEQPITLDMLSKSIFANFMYVEPTDDNILSESYMRDEEIKNVIRLMNMIYDRTLKDWNAKAAPNDALQLRLSRLFSSKSIMAWSERFKDAVCARLEINDSDDRRQLFYRRLDDDAFAKIGRIFDRLVSWQFWDSPKGSEIDTHILGAKGALKQWMREKGLTTGFLLGADE